MSRSLLGSVYTTWKYGTGNSSASRSASHRRDAAPWHFGQCRLPQELYEISVWPHAVFSQRATCPPSAAVRQRSIALITFNCSRLTCPRLASRQAGPWSRKISATSRAGRRTAAGGYAGGWSSSRVLWAFLGRLRFGRDRRSSGLSTLVIKPVAT